MKPPRWTASEWASMNLLLEARAAGACERCGKECGPVARHHRKRRREGGDSLANLLFVGAPCHVEIHSHPVESRRYGWIVSMSRDPLEVPVLWRSREWFYFEDDGTKRLLEGTLEDAHGA
jgi:hypothetical protein